MNYVNLELCIQIAFCSICHKDICKTCISIINSHSDKMFCYNSSCILLTFFFVYHVIFFYQLLLHKTLLVKFIFLIYLHVHTISVGSFYLITSLTAYFRFACMFEFYYFLKIILKIYAVLLFFVVLFIYWILLCHCCIKYCI